MLPLQNNPQLRLLQIVPRRTFCDRKAYQSTDGKFNPKFKVFIKKTPSEIGSYLFFPTTSKEWRLRKSSAVIILPTEWEWKKNGYFIDKSIIDIENINVLNKEDLIEKITDTQNHFQQIAIVNEDKFQSLVSTYKEWCLKDRNKVSQEIKNLVDVVFSDTEKEVEDLVSKFKI
ncbi:MAG: hypothetical protein PHT88_05210 [Candidatus Moranbacteria bacterium]|nr:hypothetical protein [Candidatus Moranbacteria bacterium]